MIYGIWEGSLAAGCVIAPFVTPMSVTSNQPVFISDTLSLKRTTFSRTAQRWEISTNLFPQILDANQLFVNMVTKGRTGILTVLMPQNYAVTQKRKSVSALINATGVKGTSSITVSNFDAGKLIPMGSFIQFTGNNAHKKVYMTTADFGLTAATTMSIYPSLRMDVSLGTTFSFKDDILMPCSYDTDTVIGMTYTDGIMMNPGTVKLVERV